MTANGKGIGIAAQYYFSKQVQDLDLAEGAFIAGSDSKRQVNTILFHQVPLEEREKAWSEANQRKNYVLRRMYEQRLDKRRRVKRCMGSRFLSRKVNFVQKKSH